MKKVILIEILLSFAVGMLLYFAIIGFVNINRFIELISDPFYATEREVYERAIRYHASKSIPALLAALSTLAAMIIIAIKDFPCFKPLVEKVKAKREAKAVAKAEKAEADKQARIEKLQAELDELKKDE